MIDRTCPASEAISCSACTHCKHLHLLSGTVLSELVTCSDCGRQFRPRQFPEAPGPQSFASPLTALFGSQAGLNLLDQFLESPAWSSDWGGPFPPPPAAPAEFPILHRRLRTNLVLGGVCLLVVGLLLVLATVNLAQGPHRVALLSIPLLAIVALGAYCLLPELRRMTSLVGLVRVVADSDGLLLDRGKTARRVGWQDVEAVWASVHGPTTMPRPGPFGPMGTIQGPPEHSYRIDLASGKRLYFNLAVQDVATLGTLLLAQSARRQLPGVVARINAGGSVGFGTVAVSRRGLSVDGLLVPWDDVKSVDLEQQRVVRLLTATSSRMVIVVSRKSDSACYRLPAAKVPNPRLFYALARALSPAA